MNNKERTKIYSNVGLKSIILYVSNHLPEERRKPYLRKILNGLKSYEPIPRKEGTPSPEVHKNELQDLNDLNLENPDHMLKFIIETSHLTYNERRARIIRDSLLETL